MLEGIEVITHSSIKINRNKIIYIDPFNIEKDYNDADIIFITHSHYDHFSIEDIFKVRKDDTLIVAPKDLYNKIKDNNFKDDNVLIVEPNKSYTINNISFTTVPAYNIDKSFHPKENGWVGYIINLNNIKYYIAGDTDMTDDNVKVICDVAFVPVGGTYTMNAEEAARLVNIIKPKIAVPIHYGSIVGTIKDAENFIKLLDNDIEGKILMSN